MQLDVRTIESAEAAELYIHATPRAGADLHEQGKEVFAGIAEALKTAGARILEERVLGVAEGSQALLEARAGAYGDLDDGVRPTMLAVPMGMQGDLSGVFVHAVVGAEPECISFNGVACGRRLGLAQGEYVSLSGLTAPDAGDESAQARAMLEKAEAALRTVGGDMHAVARTWMWLKDILKWYGPFNDVRTQFFHERGLLDDHTGKRELPASTGIGVGPAGPGDCAIDLVAIVKAGENAEHMLAGGNQNPAYDYGSAFSRASVAATPGGQTVFVSGTAAIDADGETERVGDIDGQIEATIKHVRAVLTDANCTDDDVVNSLIYCKTDQVEAAFREKFSPQLSWPRIVVIADVCRDDLLFEIEAAAMPGAKKVQ